MGRAKWIRLLSFRKMKTYPLFNKVYHEDSDGLLIGVFRSQKSASDFVKINYPKFKRRKNQSGFTQNGIETSMTWFCDATLEILHCDLDYPQIIFVEQNE